MLYIMKEDESIKNAEYQHFKGGRYVVVGVAIDATNGMERRVVVYRSVHESTLFVRSVDEFLQKVEWPDGIMRARFVKANSL